MDPNPALPRPTRHIRRVVGRLRDRAGPGALLLMLQACTTVTIHAGDGTVSMERSLGFVTIRPAPGDTAMVLHSTTLGWQSSIAGHQLGFATARLTLLPPTCHLVLVDPSTTEGTDSRLQALARSGLCRADAPPTQGERK